MLSRRELVEEIINKKKVTFGPGFDDDDDDDDSGDGDVADDRLDDLDHDLEEIERNPELRQK